MNSDIDKLKRTLLSGSPILFTGAGFSRGGKNQKKNDIPDGNQLKLDILKKLLLYKESSTEYKELSKHSLSEICSYCRDEIAESKLTDFLVDNYSNCTPDEFHLAYSKYTWKKIYTVNIDDLLENSFPQDSLLIQNMNRTNTLDRGNKLEYIKLHGCVRNRSEGFVFTSRDYIDSMLKSRDYRFSQFGIDIQTEDFIFIGFSYEEINLDYYTMLYEQNSGSSKGRLFLVNPKPSIILEKKIQKLGGIILKWTAQDFATFLEKEIFSTCATSNTNENIEGFYCLNSNLSTLKKFNSYRSNLYLGYEPKWQDVLDDWDFRNEQISDALDTFMSYNSTHDINHSIFSIVGKTMSGKSVFLKRLGISLLDEGYQVYEFIGRRFDYYSFLNSAKIQPSMKFCLIIDNASYYYGALKTLLKIFPKHKELLIICSSRPFFHNRKRYNLILDNFYEFNIEDGIDQKYASEIESKLDKKGYLGELRKKDENNRIQIIMKSNDVSNILFNITYGKGFYRRFQNTFKSQFHSFSDEAKELLITLSLFNKLDIAYYPLEILTLIFQRKSKITLIEIEDFIRYNEHNAIELRNNYLTNIIYSKSSYKDIVGIIKTILVNISPQVDDGVHSFWNEIQSTLMKEKLLRKELGLKTSVIKNMLFDIQSYYNDNYNYWLQVGISEQMENEYEKALNHFKQAESLSPDSYMVQNAIARNFLKQANFYDDFETAKPYFEEGQKLMLNLINNREEFQVRAFSTHCYLYEKINYLNKFKLCPSDSELKEMFSLLKVILDKDAEDGMAKHISNKLFVFLKKHKKTNVIRGLNFYDLSTLKTMFQQYNIDIESLFEDFELD
ncbi:SIR2 family protein [Dysgonomonas capnocytophagoides]|uniref:SIR2 family protein n=1 Tax=Dysgonomonas capnocytophagoides TaxID=45254 RepID=UPI0039929F08